MDFGDSDDDKQPLTDDGGADWETASEENDACSDDGLSRDSDHNEASDGDFEDAWLDDYLPDAVPDAKSGGSEEETLLLQSFCNPKDSHEQRSSQEEELNTTPSLTVIDGTGKSITSLLSPKLAGFKSVEGTDFVPDRISAPQFIEPSSSAIVHPVPNSTSLDQSGENGLFLSSPLTPLSPTTSPYKRANNLCFSPSQITVNKILIAQQCKSNEEVSTGLTRSRSYSHVSDLETIKNKFSSRLLDETKRKKMWQDLKRVEESFVAPSCGIKSEKLALTNESASQSTATEANLDTVLHTFQAEVAAPLQGDSLLVKQQNEAHDESNVKCEDVLNMNASCESAGKFETSATSQSSVASFVSDTIASSLPISPFTASVSFSNSSTPNKTPISGSQVEQLRHEDQSLHQEKRNLQPEKQNLQHESSLLQIEKARDVSGFDYEKLQHFNVNLQQLNEKMTQFSEKQLYVHVLERENRDLKEKTQKLDMEALSANELVKTLHNQLALTIKSEEQLKLQIKQLMEHNHSLQTDLLEKIASETTKFQNLTKLSAENDSLVMKLERKDNAASERKRDREQRMHGLVIFRLLRLKRRDALYSALFQWAKSARSATLTRFRAVSLLRAALSNRSVKLKAAAFSKLKSAARDSYHTASVVKLQGCLDTAKREAKAYCIMLGVMHLNRLVDNYKHRQATRTISTWKTVQHKRRIVSHSLELGFTKLNVLLVGQNKIALRRALSMWHFTTAHEQHRSNLERLHQLESSMAEAKECIFSLSRAKAKLANKLQTSNTYVQCLGEKVTESESKLQHVKHAFGTLVIRDIERAWYRTLLSQWRMQTLVSVATKELRLKMEMAELKVAERDRYSKALDDYSRVLRDDLERFQFFSLDNKITVDALSKKLLREEERYRLMEERNVMLEDKSHALQTQLTSIVEWDGLVLPLSVLSLCKDVAVSNLQDLFQLYTAADKGMAVQAGRVGSEREGECLSPRLALASLVRILECSPLLQEKVVQHERIAERLASHLPSYAVDHGLVFAEFITCLNQFLDETFADSNTKHEQLKRFWANLLSLSTVYHGRKVVGFGGGDTGNNGCVHGAAENGTTLLVCPSSTSWVGRLSDDILQNQDKLLAMLEHETAVVERAVKEKASLKHTYQPNESTSTGSNGSASFFEYQCDPLLPTKAPLPATSATMSGSIVNSAAPDPDSAVAPIETTHAVSMEVYTNWHLLPQVHDLCLALRTPLLHLFAQYASGQSTPALENHHSLSLAAIIRMLSDLKLHPAYLSREFVQSLFDRLGESSDTNGGFLTPQGFTLFLGSCALELYARSLARSQPNPLFLLSAREVLLTFFDDLGLLAKSTILSNARLCMVGMDAETMLWPLFEYYAKAADSIPNLHESNARIGMTRVTFERFMRDIAGKAADDSHALFRQVMQASSKSGAKGDEQLWRMHLDEFYIAISYMESEEKPGTAYATPGEAVRQWLQHSQ